MKCKESLGSDPISTDLPDFKCQESFIGIFVIY